MSATDSQDADDEATEDEFIYYGQAKQHPTTIIEGTVEEIVGTVPDETESTDNSYGVVFNDVEVVGTAWRNRNVPDGFDTVSEYHDTIKLAAADPDDGGYIRTTEVTEASVNGAREELVARDVIEDADVEIDVSYSQQDGMTAMADGEDISVDDSTDFKIADENDRDASIQEIEGNVLGIDVGGGTYSASPVDSIDTPIMVWYGGMAGQRVSRALDTNGLPFARETEDGYTIPGLYQAPKGWRGEADEDQYGTVPSRSKLKQMGRVPRKVRPPVLRDDLEGRIFIALSRYNGGDMHEVHVGRAMDDYTELVETMRANEDPSDLYDEVGLRYNDNADEVLSAEFDNPNEVFAFYDGEGWAAPSGDVFDTSGDDNSGGSFDTGTVDVGDDDVEHPTEKEREFAEMVSGQIEGKSVTPEQNIFTVDGSKTDLDGLIEHNRDDFDVEPNVEAIRDLIYEQTSHL